MNETIQLLLNRRSIRAYEDREIGAEKDAILQATLRAPTAGNMMLYSIIEVNDQAMKDTLARTCDNQPFIARAPLVWLFLADYQRWFDYYLLSGVEELCQRRGEPLRKPQEGDLFLACCDALIAAQTAVVAAEVARHRLLLHRRHHGELRDPSGPVWTAPVRLSYLPPVLRLSDPGANAAPFDAALRPEVHRLLRIATGGWIGPISTRCIGTSRSGLPGTRIGPVASPTSGRPITCGSSAPISQRK